MAIGRFTSDSPCNFGFTHKLSRKGIHLLLHDIGREQFYCKGNHQHCTKDKDDHIYISLTPVIL